MDTEPVPQSMLSWMLSSLGAFYTIVIPLAGLVCFVLALLVVMRGRGPLAGAALVLIVHVPLLIGIFAAIQGAIASYQVIAMSAVAPKPSHVAAAVSTSLFAPLASMLVIIPGYAAAAIGAFVRCMSASADERK